jgi:hypothetical protein
MEADVYMIIGKHQVYFFFLDGLHTSIWVLRVISPEIINILFYMP